MAALARSATAGLFAVCLAAAATDAATDDGTIRIGLVDIELDTKRDAAKRLDRIGAAYEFVPANAPMERLAGYDVIYFPAGWGRLSGLARLAEAYHEYVQKGGGLLFAEADTDGGPEKSPALRLLPYSITVTRYGIVGGGSVRAYPPGKPHPLMHQTDVEDLPYPYDDIGAYDPRWTVLALAAEKPDNPTILAAEVGRGRVLVHTNPDDYGHGSYFKDPFVVRILKWLARRPDEDVRSQDQRLGPRRFPEYVRQLDEDYRRLLAQEPARVQAALERADHLLRYDAQQSSTWTAYTDAIDLIHRNRSKAAIPLLLKLLADDALRHDNYDDAAYQALSFLTGRPVTGKTPEEVAKHWWFPQKDRMTVQVAEMSESEAGAIAEQLLDFVTRNEPYGDHRHPPFSPQAIDAILRGGYRFYAGRYAQALDKRLLPVLLDVADDPRRRWLLPGPLAAMYHLDRARELPQLAVDGKSSAGRRVIAAAALFRAGKPVPADQLVAIFRDLSEVDLQMATVWLLGQSKSPAAVETVVGCLHHPSAPVVETAALAVRYQQSPAAVEPLEEIIRRKLKAGKDPAPFIRALGSIETRRAAEILADLLEDVLRTDPEGDVLGELVSAFGSVAGRSFYDYGSSNSEKAAKALDWWYER